MVDTEQQATGFVGLAGRLVRTGVGALRNRFELLVLEWQEERALLAELMIWLVALLILGILAVLLFTATIILLFPTELRVYAAAGFTVVYLVGAVVASLVVRSLLKRKPFSETLDQARKDADWLQS
jgi:uncharacterized membrane protein YqjE